MAATVFPLKSFTEEEVKGRKEEERFRRILSQLFIFATNQLNKHFAQIMASNILACYLTDFIMKLIS